jgi:ClpP class serine protease
MSFNYALSQEIYGGIPWMMDSVSFMTMSAILKNSRNNVSLELPQIKYNTPQLLNSETKIITRPFGNEWSPGQLDNNEDFSGVGIINLDGAITLSGGMSSVGMEQLSSMMLLMSQDKRMVGFIVRSNSGGGSSTAVGTMSDAILEVRAMGLPVYASIKKGGMAASACYGIISACEKIFSEDGMNIVGSVGTMVQFEGREANTTDKDGVKHIRVYATKSVRKNEDFEKALNEDHYDLLVNDLLDPVNDNFIAKILNNRPQLAGSKFDDGHTLFSKDAIGTFIDGIASFTEVISMVESVSKIESKSNNNNSNSNKMTKEELKQQHPTVYSEVIAEGVSNEKDRVGSWMAYSEADPKAVAEGISSGRSITATESNQFLVAIAQKGRLNAFSADNAVEIVSKETTTEPIAEKTAAQLELEAASDFTIKI